jgi:hypothetical protein
LIRKEVPKGSKTIVDLSNPDKVHIDTGASKEEVKLLDVAKEVVMSFRVRVNNYLDPLVIDRPQIKGQVYLDPLM